MLGGVGYFGVGFWATHFWHVNYWAGAVPTLIGQTIHEAESRPAHHAETREVHEAEWRPAHHG